MKKIYCLVVLIILFIGCSKDNPETGAEKKFEKSPFSMELIPHKEIISNPQIQEKLQKISSNQKKSDERTVFLEAHDIFIFTDSATYITNGKFDSYTFRTVQGDNEKIKNILFNKNKEGDYDAYLVEYNYSWKEFRESDPTENTNEFRLTPLKLTLDSLNQKQMASIWVCTYEYLWTPDQGQLQANHLSGWVLVATDCRVVRYEIVDNNYSPSYYSDFIPNGETATYTSGGSTYTSPTGGGAMYDEDYLLWLQTVKSELGSRLNNIQRNYLDSHVSVTMQNLMFLRENSFSEEAKDFSAEAIKAVIYGGEVDFDERVILDTSFRSNAKTKKVYDNLKNLSSTIFNDIINDHFQSSKEANIKFDIGAIPDENGFSYKARTYASYNGSDKYIRIRLKDTFVQNASTMEIALAIIHELVHAELLVRSIESGLILNITPSGAYSFSNYGNPSPFTSFNVFNALATYYKNLGSGNPQWNHDLFNILELREGIAANLMAVHPWLDDPQDPFENYISSGLITFSSLSNYFEYLAWAGLEGTQEYINLSSTEKAKISYSINLLNNYNQN
ncbi:hypothetical protein LZ575_05715 [Antarcticibacterium sp. 1MA-6-2]|uniref:hypothetical protein n=1 Tax=Antarcticibacterium sp. 1MA-6-2 TaxID=2908210 RepID=UPI001F28FD4C|nr:hypothetical protein [Antarcticibacterium sp. 1MA-6-2]UJH92097.1 hypothetical protein LZ575_05715 [Antarcticibacterium sp. 1MA-6-2]